jgi:hypothetical protein
VSRECFVRANLLLLRYCHRLGVFCNNSCAGIAASRTSPTNLGPRTVAWHDSSTNPAGMTETQTK